MENVSVKAKLNTDFTVKPVKSQVLLVTLIIVAGLCLLVGFYFLSIKPEVSWVPILIGILIIILAYKGWSRSQKDIDLDAAAPAQLVDKQGNQLTIDNRALYSPQIIQNIEKFFTALSHRNPLPPPDGLVDGLGNPILNSKNDAEKIISEINAKIQESINKAISTLNLEIEQREKPLINEPKSEIIIATTRSETDS